MSSYRVGQGLAPAEKDGTSKPVPYNKCGKLNAHCFFEEFGIVKGVG